MKKLLIIFLLLNSSIIFAKVPQFSDYPAPVFKGKNVAMQLNENTKNYRTRFGYLKNEKPNFAGHYVIDFFGCGTSCIIGIAFNVRNGATQFLPSGALTACYKEASFTDYEIYYRANSRLFITSGGYDNEEGCSTKYFIEQNGQFKLIKTQPF